MAGENDNALKPTVAIVGRPNVGKSTLFNRLSRTRNALVENVPGVTRDRIYADAVWNDFGFTVVDTGGFSPRGDALSPQIMQQIRDALAEAHAVVFMLDGKGGLSPFDADIMPLVRKLPKPVFYVVNKIDGPLQEAVLTEFYRLGVDTLYPLSAAHGYGLHDFIDALVAALSTVVKGCGAALDDAAVNIAVVGRPNVGKSSLVNRILLKERVLVSDVPGTTRDAVDTLYRKGGKCYRLIDTAGIRRKRSVHEKIEKVSIVKALHSLDRCDVALIVMDAADGVADQDVTIAGYAHDRGCGCILVLNKWDLVPKGRRAANRYKARVREAAKFLHFAPIVSLSALTGYNVRHMFNVADEVYRQYGKRIATARINRIVEEALAQNEPSLYRGRRLKFYYTTQVAAKPPSFVSFVNFPQAVHFSYHRYLVNRIRHGTGMTQTPVRLWFRKRIGRLESSKRRR